MRSEILGIAVVLAAMVPSGRTGLEARQKGPAEPPGRYRVAAAFDPATQTITGTARIQWRNPASIPATELRLVVPWNSRRDDHSSWALEQRTGARAGSMSFGAPAGGSLDLTAVSLEREQGALDRLRETVPVSPDDGNAADRTVWTVPLDRPVAPGQTVGLAVSWKAVVPPLANGFGSRRTVVVAAAWIPRIGVFTDQGWHAHQTRAAGIPAAVARFEVDLRLPGGWVVGGTGRTTGRQAYPDQSVSHRFEVDGAPDLAWVASPDFVERVVRVEQQRGTPVDVRLLLSREHASQGERHLAAVRHALAAYNAWFAAYPWPSLTVADVPEDAGLERTADRSPLVASHPGVVAVTTPWILPWASGGLDRALVAGIGDQFWGAFTLPDGVDDTWLTRGIPAYVAERVTAERFGTRFAPVRRYFNGLITWPFTGIRRSAAEADLPRETLPFVTLERFLGFETVKASLATYLVRGRGRHPTTAEFLAIAGSVANRDLAWFFDATTRPHAEFNYAVSNVASAAAGPAAFESAITLRRLGDGVFPVETLVTFADGSSLVDHWDGAAETRTVRYTRSQPVSRVEIDPGRTLALESERLDNSWTSTPAGHLAGQKWSRRWAAWFQHLLVTYAFFV